MATFLHCSGSVLYYKLHPVFCYNLCFHLVYLFEMNLFSNQHRYLAMGCSFGRAPFTAAPYLEGAGGRIRRCWWQRSLGYRNIWEGYFSSMENLYFHLLLSLCFCNSETQLFLTLITRQSCSQQRRHYNIKQPASPISVRNSESSNWWFWVNCLGNHFHLCSW